MATQRGSGVFGGEARWIGQRLTPPKTPDPLLLPRPYGSLRAGLRGLWLGRLWSRSRFGLRHRRCSRTWSWRQRNRSRRWRLRFWDRNAAVRRLRGKEVVLAADLSRDGVEGDGHALTLHGISHVTRSIVGPAERVQIAREIRLDLGTLLADFR